MAFAALSASGLCRALMAGRSARSTSMPVISGDPDFAITEGENFPVLPEAAKRGPGVAILPEMTCPAAVAGGERQVVSPCRVMLKGTAHLGLPTRRRLPTGVRVPVDFSAECLSL